MRPRRDSKEETYRDDRHTQRAARWWRWALRFQSPVGPEEPGGMQQHMREQKCNSESHSNAKEINTERLTKGMYRCRTSQGRAEPQKDLQTPQYTKRWRQDT